MSLHPSLAATRRGVRLDVADLAPGSAVLVACSGGADSLALLAATVHTARDQGLYVVGVTVDHGLQEGSRHHAAHVVEQMAGLGVAETIAASVTVEGDGRGMEDAARRARYAVLAELSQRFEARTVLLGHTRDDQAETVLLGLARGSGGRSLAGMRRRFVDGGTAYRRPLLDVSRVDTETACQVEGIGWWIDPHNLDPAYTRVRVRRTVLPVLEEHLGPGVAATLARTADQLRADADFLDDLAASTYAQHRDDAGLRLDVLDGIVVPIRTRMLRLAALEAGATASELFHSHVQELVRLVAPRTGGASPREVQLPGRVTAHRASTPDGDRLRFRGTSVQG